MNKTTADGLGDNWIFNIYASGSTIYAATAGGLSISTDAGQSFVNNPLGPIVVNDVYVSTSGN